MWGLYHIYPPTSDDLAFLDRFPQVAVLSKPTYKQHSLDRGFSLFDLLGYHIDREFDDSIEDLANIGAFHREPTPMYTEVFVVL